MKIKSIAIAIFGVLVLTSCKKDYNCTCTTVSTTPEFVFGGQTVQQGSTTSASGTTIITDTKSDAKTECESGSASATVASGYASFGAEPTTVTTTCSIAN